MIIENVVYAHRSQPSVLVQEIIVVNRGVCCNNAFYIIIIILVIIMYCKLNYNS